MKLPFSLFGKKPKPPERAENESVEERAPFPVELAVAQVQAATGMRFGPPQAQQPELLEAAAVLSLPQDLPISPAAEEVQPTPAPLHATAPSFPAVAVQAVIQAPVAPPQPLPTPTPVIAPAQAAAPVALSAAAPVAPEEVLALPPTPSPAEAAAEVGIGRDEVVAAYRLFLRREPESEAVIEPRLGISREKLLSAFIVSPKFLQHADNVKLVLEVAKSLELRQPATAAAPGIPVLTHEDVEAAKRIFWPDPHDQAIQPPVGETADRTLSHLMRSEHFQKNEFNATLVIALARQIVERLNKN